MPLPPIAFIQRGGTARVLLVFGHFCHLSHLCRARLFRSAQEWGPPHTWPDLARLARFTSGRGAGTRGTPPLAGTTGCLCRNDACNQCRGWSGDGAMGCCRGVERTALAPNDDDLPPSGGRALSEPSLRTGKHKRGDIRWQADVVFLFKVAAMLPNSLWNVATISKPSCCAMDNTVLWPFPNLAHVCK